MTRNRRHCVRGFTVIEMMIASAVMLTVMSAIFAVVSPARATFQAQGEVDDMHQRLRAALDMLAGDVRAADGVRPYRVGGSRDDAAAGIYYRPDTIAVLDVPSSALSADALATRTYYLKSDARADVFELMQFDGRQTDLPVVEHVVGLAFDYFGDPQAEGAALVKLDPAILIDGPWLEDASGHLFDRDVLCVRRVHVRLRLESADASLRGPAGTLFVHGGLSGAAGRAVPDEAIEMHVAPRNVE
jgi:prepilin-type N-terminal cleavage/methylation domain-containing protein